jgi:hypothetical protein
VEGTGLHLACNSIALSMANHPILPHRIKKAFCRSWLTKLPGRRSLRGSALLLPLPYAHRPAILPAAIAETTVGADKAKPGAVVSTPLTEVDRELCPLPLGARGDLAGGGLKLGRHIYRRNRFLSVLTA